MDEMSERLARQVALEITEIYGDEAEWKWPDDFTGDTIDRSRSRAEAILSAMREPTKAMLTAENVYLNCCICGGHLEGWQALIDAARQR